MPPQLIPVVYLIAGILAAGAIVWGLNQLPGIDPAFKQVARVVLIVVLVIWAIYIIVGLLTGSLAVPRLSR